MARKRVRNAKRSQAARRPRAKNARVAGGQPARAEELAAEPRALLGRDEQARPKRPRKDDASVQDPLGDWPED